MYPLEHFIALYTGWLIKKAEKMWKKFEVFEGMKIFTFREMHEGEKLMGKIVAFLSSVIYYLGDLLKSANRTFLWDKYSLDPVSRVTEIPGWYWILGIKCSDTTGVRLVYWYSELKPGQGYTPVSKHRHAMHARVIFCKVGGLLETL